MTRISATQKQNRLFVASQSYKTIQEIEGLLMKGEQIWTKKQSEFAYLYLSLFLEALKYMKRDIGKFIDIEYPYHVLIDGLTLSTLECQVFNKSRSTTERGNKKNLCQKRLWEAISNKLNDNSIDWERVTSRICEEELRIWLFLHKNVSDTQRERYAKIVEEGIVKRKAYKAQTAYDEQKYEVDSYAGPYFGALRKLEKLKEYYKGQGIRVG